MPGPPRALGVASPALPVTPQDSKSSTILMLLWPSQPSSPLWPCVLQEWVTQDRAGCFTALHLGQRVAAQGS